ncbi:hypothetical protein GCM10025876_18140 [Demequina litorisediminis]|uniref:Uncharacterized protein n=1 Tax=Demequina litorisediminis TaxID=1849022 RepID=A0ABQ6IE69_9MICO|nr:hypothetical protein GCM10025876_18140 [Demequina litorisediminis]
MSHLGEEEDLVAETDRARVGKPLSPGVRQRIQQQVDLRCWAQCRIDVAGQCAVTKHLVHHHFAHADFLPDRVSVADGTVVFVTPTCVAMAAPSSKDVLSSGAISESPFATVSGGT